MLAVADTSPINYLLLRSEEHTSELQSRLHLVCRLLLEKKKTHHYTNRQSRQLEARPHHEQHPQIIHTHQEGQHKPPIGHRDLSIYEVHTPIKTRQQYLA